ncbi:hypothetical protein SAMN04490244_101280 [Tranquillimonas rosea]|uniref:Uncharacterized protein n=1 Tax=Tranquillimonas rosea TaxID=641238 RepID=A0A1H9PPP4_9RHOB|nr:hypothetical protein [Tranquillimonas rosea]SER50184.1 hypothetical protein SAMN04490244_101280 [Tranquillimonas rosea]
MIGTHIRITALAGDDRRPEFFVTAIEAEGIPISLWQGSSYERAILIAEKAREDFGPVYDYVPETYPFDPLRER